MRRLPSQRAPRWASLEDRRYPDQGRVDGTSSTATTWASRPRTWRAEVADHARTIRMQVRGGRRRTRRKRRSKSGRFKDEIVPGDREGPARASVVVDTDEFIRVTASPIERHFQVSSPAFNKRGQLGYCRQCQRASTTARRPIVLMSAERSTRSARPHAARHDPCPGRPCRCRSQNHGHRARSPPRSAALKKGGMAAVKDLDLIEANEAFAAQALRRRQGYSGWDHGEGECEWRRHRHRPPHRRQRVRACLRLYCSSRCRSVTRIEGPRHALHRRRHGHRDVRSAGLIAGRCRIETLPGAP